MAKRTKMEKGMRNKRYRRTEGKILGVFFVENKKGTTIGKMAKKAGISRATMYTHHRAIREVIPDYRRYILEEYSRLVRKKMRKKNLPLKAVYFETLFFILRNRKIFEMLIEFGDVEALARILEKIRPKIIASARIPKSAKKVFRVYMSEVIEIIIEWRESGFSEEKIEEVLSNIMYLTETAKKRLMPIDQ